MPKVSVIIPIYNTEKYLRKCLDSVCNQTLSDIEIICVNDCSTDNSLEILEEYASKDNRIKLIDFKENKGAAVARNAGIDEAKGEYIGFVDSDDYIDSDFYEKLYNEAKLSDADVVRGNILVTDNNQKRYDFEDLFDEIQKTKVRFNGLFTCAIYKSDFVKSNNILFLENYSYGEDRLFPFKAVILSNKFSTVRNTYYNYFRHSQSASASETLSDKKIIDYVNSTDMLIDFAVNKVSKDDLALLTESFIGETFSVIKNSKDNNHYLYDFLKKLFLLKNDLCPEFKKFSANLINDLNKNNYKNIHNNYYNILSRIELFKKLRRNINSDNSSEQDKSVTIFNKLSDFVDVYNSAEVSKNEYIKAVFDKYTSAFETFGKKFDENNCPFEELIKIAENIENKIKYKFDYSKYNKLEIAYKIKQNARFTPESIDNKIPKRIFYVWCGNNKKPISAEICIDNWREKLPQYEIIEINENSTEWFDFPSEIENVRWLKDVYDRQLWAFVSDYIRCKVLYDHGGIYFDTDITVKKDFDDLLKYDFFIGEEDWGRISAGVIGSVAKHEYMKDMVDFYKQDVYQSPLYILPDVLSYIYKENEYNNVRIFPTEYFYPFPHQSVYTPDCVTENTYTVHWWNESWVKSPNVMFLKSKHLLSKMRSNIKISR